MAIIVQEMKNGDEKLNIVTTSKTSVYLNIDPSLCS